MSSPQKWSNKQRQGHSLHRICAYQGSFPPQLPAYFLDKYSEARVVLDPFAGRGTTVLEATLRGKTVYGSDLLSVAQCLSSVKLRCPPRSVVLEEIEALELDASAPSAPEEVEPFFHKQTWKQVWNLREGKRSEALTALALGRMHGHSPGFFSTKTFNVISVRGDSLKRAMKKHNSSPEPRDVKKILTDAAGRFLSEEGHDGDGAIFNADACRIPLPRGSVDLVVTSPPFLDVIDYEDVNWLRQWFIGEGIGRPMALPEVTGNIERYTSFLHEVLQEMKRLLSRMGRIVFEVGPVKRQANMVDLVCEAAEREKLLVVEDVVVHEFSGEGEGKSTPKISRAMRGGKETTTMKNQCVVMRAR